MLQNLKSFCERLDYYQSDGDWAVWIEPPNYFENLEMYIAGDANGLNLTLEKAAVRVQQL